MYKSTYKSTKLGRVFSTLPSFSKATLSLSQKLKSDINNLILAYNLFLLACVRRTVYIVLLLAGSVGVASSAPLPMPNSEVSYPGASTTQAFVATEPYVVNIQDVSTTISLRGAPRTHDFSGNVPFVNPKTGQPDASSMQAWDPVFAASFSPMLGGNYDLYGKNLTNAGFPGRVDKRTLNGTPVTMVRYNVGDGLTWDAPRSKLNAYAVPTRTHVRWELEVAFGKADGENDWDLTPTTRWVQDSSGTWVIASGSCPVLFWQLKSDNQGNSVMQADVDTDNLDPTKLMVFFSVRAGGATKVTEIGRVHGIPRHTLTPIVIDAFLDERANSNGGKGLVQIWVNNTLAVEKAGPTLSLGKNEHWWSIDTYLWGQTKPASNTRAAFYKTAKMLVFPTDATANSPISSTTPATSADTTAPSVPANLAATSPDASKVNLTWSASTDNVGVAGYRIYRNNTQIGTSTVASFADTSVVGGTSYNFTVKAYDNAGNLSASSNTATVTTPTASSGLSISSYSMNPINKWDATVNWTTNVPSSAVVYYSRSTASLDSSASYTAMSTSHSLQLTNLWDGYTYYYKIVAKDSKGATYTSPVSTFKTKW